MSLTKDEHAPLLWQNIIETSVPYQVRSLTTPTGTCAGLGLKRWTNVHTAYSKTEGTGTLKPCFLIQSQEDQWSQTKAVQNKAHGKERTKLPVERSAIWVQKAWNSEVRNNTIHTWKSLGTQPSKHSVMFRGCWTTDYRTFEYGLGDLSMVLEPNCKAPRWLTQETGPLPYCKGKHQHSWDTTAPRFNDSAIS